MSTLTDEELDTAIMAILTVFPHFGRAMIAGRLQSEVLRGGVCRQPAAQGARGRGEPRGVGGDERADGPRGDGRTEDQTS